MVDPRHGVAAVTGETSRALQVRLGACLLACLFPGSLGVRSLQEVAGLSLDPDDVRFHTFEFRPGDPGLGLSKEGEVTAVDGQALGAGVVLEWYVHVIDNHYPFTTARFKHYAQGGSNYNLTFTEVQVVTDTCRDQPDAWKDSMKRTCSDYEDLELCTPLGRYGTGWDMKRRCHWWQLWCRRKKTFEANAAGGLSALDACCACGGGVLPVVTTTTTERVSTSSAPNTTASATSATSTAAAPPAASEPQTELTTESISTSSEPATTSEAISLDTTSAVLTTALPDEVSTSATEHVIIFEEKEEEGGTSATPEKLAWKLFTGHCFGELHREECQDVRTVLVGLGAIAAVAAAVWVALAFLGIRGHSSSTTDNSDVQNDHFMVHVPDGISPGQAFTFVHPDTLTRERIAAPYDGSRIIRLPRG